MALGRYGRVDNRRSSSSSYGSTVTIVVFVGLCLVGIWMMTSSSVIPDQNVYDVAQEKKNSRNEQVTPVIDNSNDRSNNVQFEDNPGYLPEDARKGDSNVSLAKDDGKDTGNLNTQEIEGNTEESKLDKSKMNKKQLDSEGGRTNNNSGENLPEDTRIGDSNVSLAKDDGKDIGNLDTQENKGNTEESKLDESKTNQKQLDSEGGQINNNSGENLPGDTRIEDTNVSGAEDGGTGNLNTLENKGNTEESKSDESKKDKKQLDSEDGRTNNNSGENLLVNARIGELNGNGAKDGGTGNLNAQENKVNTEESKLDESKKDKKQLDSEGEQTNNSDGNSSEEDRKGDSNVSLAKDDGTGNLNTQENKINEESNLDESKKDEKQLNTEGGQRTNHGANLGGLGGSEENSDDKKSDPVETGKKLVSNENDKMSDSGSGEKKPDQKSSETNGGKVDGQKEREVDQNDKNESNKKDSEGALKKNNSGKNLGGLGDSEENPANEKTNLEESNKKVVSNDKNGNNSDSGGGAKKPVNSSGTNETKVDGRIEGKVGQNDKKELDKSSGEAKDDPQVENQSLNEVSSSGAQSELLSETTTQNGSFSTQAAVSTNEKKTQIASKEYRWKFCNSTAGPDYIPCLDNWEAIRHLRTNKHYEHRERHCPEEPPTCLVPLPEGYKRPIAWPKSREKIWYRNVPHTQLAQIKGHQNWVKVTGEYLTFPGGGTQFKHGALLYIDFIEESAPEIAWGKSSRVILDVGCGVASFGGFLFDRNVLAMSLAPKDEHEAQVQFALERGIPAVSAVMGTKKLPYPGRVFDVVHCARCRVPWHIEGGKLLLELNRLLRPGGFFVWSATPVYQKGREDIEIWKAMVELTEAMCWKLVNKTTKDRINRVAVAIFKKPASNDCYNKRSKQEPPLCPDSDDPNSAWNVPLETCMHKVPVNASKRGSKWPEQWPARLEKSPYWLLSSQVGVYGKSAPEDFSADYEHWKRVVRSYRKKMGINWLSIRNVMDMKAVYGGFAAALKDLDLWVMNVVPIRSPDTLPIIYERGLFGMYHNWCESFSTYPRSYDLLHADHLFSKVKKRCNIVSVVAEVDRILRPEGILIVRDIVETINELEGMLRSMQWEVLTTFSKDKQGLLCVQKSMWRPKEVETIAYAIA